MDITKFFPGKKRDLSDQSKEQSQNDPKKVRGESQGSCSVDDSNVFDEGLVDLDCRNILYNCLKKVRNKSLTWQKLPMKIKLKVLGSLKT